MFILVACEESQAIANAYRERGHFAFSCDILPCSGGHPEYHIQHDCLPLLYSRSDISFFTQDGKYHCVPYWDIVICHPPCTFLSRAGQGHLLHGGLNLPRYKNGLLAASFFYACLKAPQKRIAVENPVPCSIYNLPSPSQVIQPCDFGHPFKKTTCLWLRHLPPLVPTSLYLPQDVLSTKQAYWFNSSVGGPDVRRSRRSKTFPGIASAIAEQWVFD